MPAQTFVDRVSTIEGVNLLKLQSGKTFEVSEIKANDGSVYRVMEASDWVALVSDWAKNSYRQQVANRKRARAMIEKFR